MNTNLLRGKIVASGLTQYKLAELLHMSKNTLSNKVQGHTSFTLEEVNRLCELLHIDDNTEKAEIFLT